MLLEKIKNMEILTNKQVNEIVYKEYTVLGEIESVVENGKILSVMNLTPPMRGNDFGLSKKEPHIAFFNESIGGVFIPVADVLDIEYA